MKTRESGLEQAGLPDLRYRGTSSYMIRSCSAILFGTAPMT